MKKKISLVVMAIVLAMSLGIAAGCSGHSSNGSSSSSQSDAASSNQSNTSNSASVQTEPEQPSLPLPANGEILIDNTDGLNYSELSITASTDASTFVKLKAADGSDVLGFFVQAGQTVNEPAPLGSYYVYFASGKDWYGLADLFGKNTVYSKDDELLDFSQYTYEFTLQLRWDGNFSTTPISPDEF